MKTLICKCQDSAGVECNKKMSKKEFKQDGMCSSCASQVWEEMSDLTRDYKWYHSSTRATMS